MEPGSRHTIQINVILFSLIGDVKWQGDQRNAAILRSRSPYAISANIAK
jgi:hypothetical protein